MKEGDLLKLFKDYFDYGIPLGVVSVIIIIVIIIFGFMYKYIKSGFEERIKESRKDFGILIKKYQETVNQQNKRIISLEKRLDDKFKGGKRKWVP